MPQRVKRPTQKVREQMAYWLARDHSCESLVVSEGPIEQILGLVGKEITRIELDKHKIPCATFQAIDVASQLANLECNGHDKQDRLERETDRLNLEEEGAEEPEPSKKDNRY